MVWQHARWRWSLVTLGIAAGCLLAFLAQPGAASSPDARADRARFAVRTTADGATRVTLLDAEAGSAVSRARWIYGSFAASALLLVAAIQYRALRRMQERRRFAPPAARASRNRGRLGPQPRVSAPWLEPSREPSWTPGLGLDPGIGD